MGGRGNVDARAVLASYGLDAVITQQDDPDLWAAVFLRHWPPADDPNFHAGSLSFGICGSLDTFWTFERAASGGGRAPLRVLSVEGDPASGGLSLPPPVSVGYPRLTLEVERPSADTDRVVVEAGTQHGPLAGRGAARVWRKAPGSGGPLAWEETEEVISVWRS